MICCRIIISNYLDLCSFCTFLVLIKHHYGNALKFREEFHCRIIFVTLFYYKIHFNIYKASRILSLHSTLCSYVEYTKDQIMPWWRRLCPSPSLWITPNLVLTRREYRIPSDVVSFLPCLATPTTANARCTALAISLYSSPGA